MLSKYNYYEVLDTVKRVGISVGTQLLHLNHVMHGLDPVVLKKGELITSYIQFLWDTHSFEDIEGYAPDIAIQKMKGVSRILDKRSIRDDILESIMSSARYKKKINGDIKQINEDYNIAIDAIEKISVGNIDGIDLKSIEIAASHIDNDELDHGKTLIESSDEDLSFTHDKLHKELQEKVEKTKRYENSIYSVMKKIK